MAKKKTFQEYTQEALLKDQKNRKQIDLRLVSGKKNSCVNHRIKDDIGKKLLWHWQSL